MRELEILSAAEGNVEAYFSPKGGLAYKLIDEINGAKKSVHAAIFSFTLNQVAEALVQAHRKGVEVKLVMDQHQGSKAQRGIYERLRREGVMAYKSANKALMHNKYAILDGQTVVTGSFNWTRNAEERNNENLLIIRLPRIAELFELNFRAVFGWHVNFYALKAVRGKS